MPDSSEQKDQTRAATEAPSQFLVAAPLPRLMLTYAMPCIISLLTGALYNIVDQIFIANARYLGSYGNAANTVVFPLTVVALAIAVIDRVPQQLGKVDHANSSVGMTGGVACAPPAGYGLPHGTANRAPRGHRL